MDRRKLILLFSAGALAAAAEGSGEEKAILDTLERLRKACEMKDRKTLEEVLDDRLMYSHSSAKLENKAEAIAALLKPDSKYEITFKKQTVHVYGNSAVTRGDAVYVVVTGGNRAVNDLNILMSWVKGPKGWRITARQSTRLPK